MSRVGKKPIPIPSGVTVKIDGPMVSVTGPKGKLDCLLHHHVSASLVDSVLTVAVKNSSEPKQAALWGVFRSLLTNMVHGVTEGYKKQLEINGIGFKAAVSGQTLTLNVGFSHPVAYAIPAGIAITVEKNVVTVGGIDKHLVGQVAAEVRDVMPPEPYKGKGIKYLDEVIRRKAGKLATKTE